MSGFERGMKTAGLVAGPLLGLAIYLWNPGGHPPEARRLLGVIVLAICFWITEAIPLPATALLASALAIVTGVAPARIVLAPYADPVIFLFIGSFLLSESVRKYGLDRRVAAVMMRSRLFGKSPGGLIAGFGVASAGVSTCLSNTATAAMMTPIAVGGVRQAGEGGGARRASWASALVLMIAYGASVGGMATIIGTPPNLLTAGLIERLAGVRVTFTGWLMFGTPIALVLLVLSVAWVRLVLARDLAAVTVARPDHSTEPESPEERAGRRWTIVAFGLAAFLWTLPALLSALLGAEDPFVRRLTAILPESGVALLCASLLFVAPVDWRERRFTLTWSEGRDVNWGIILLFGGGLSLGTLATSTGIAKWAGEGISGTSLAATPVGLLMVSVGMSILISEFASNTASATLVVPIVVAAAQAAGLDPVRPALAAGLAATCGFIFPVSTPPNAIVFGTGLVPLWTMIRVGVLLDLSSFVVIVLGMLALTPLLPHP